MGLFAARLVTIAGRTYKLGDPVDARLFSSEKAQQLIAQRILTDTDVAAPKWCIALRAMRIGGVDYQRGDRIDVRGLRADKVSQLLDHRILDLAPAVIPPAGQAEPVRTRRARA